MTDTGKLQDLNLKPGDVVECVKTAGNWWTPGKHYTIQPSGGPIDDGGADIWNAALGWPGPEILFRVVSRASDAPKLWGDMTPEEKGALLLAQLDGKAIQVSRGNGWNNVLNPKWEPDCSYRVRPEPVREKLVMHGGAKRTGYFNFSGAGGVLPNDTHRITFDVVDGKPDCASIKMEEL